MIDGLLGRGSIPVLRSALAFSQERHRVLANNVANIETPGYAMKDLPVASFKQALTEAVSRRDAAGDRFLALRSDDFRRTPGGSWTADPVDVAQGGLRHDANNVSAELAMSRLMENGLWHNGLSTLLSHEYNLLETAIRGRA